jgi:hypothetical protein
MTNHVLLENTSHKNLRINTGRATQYYDSVICTVVFPIELRQIESEYPIVFRKNSDTGGFEPVALFGLAERENLFLTEEGWSARYVPMSIERQPFLIGLQTGTKDGVQTEEPLIYIDMDSPRISQGDGEPVFQDQGGSTPYLDHINSVLLAIHEGHAHNRHFSAALAELGLLEPFSLDVALDDHSRLKLAGFYTINEDALQRLQPEALAALHSKGYIENIYMSIASLSNLRTLIELKKSRL